MNKSDINTMDTNWENLYKAGGVAVLMSVLVGLLDFAILFSSGEIVGPVTLSVVDWFTLFQNNWFLGLRNLGILNVIGCALNVVVFLALYAAHRRKNKAFAALSAILLFIGSAVYISNNAALSMLALRKQYAAATTESQRSLIAAAGQAMLVQAEDFAPGSFMGFFISEAAGVLMAIVMLRGRIFSRVTAWVSILGYGLLLVCSTCAVFIPGIINIALIGLSGGGLLIMVAYFLIARRFFQLGRGVVEGANLS